MEALHDTVRAGKVRYLGASTMYAWQFAKMNHVAAMNGWTPFVNMQCQYNVLYREEEREMLPYCRDQGIAVTTFSPLARGFLARDGRTARTTHDLYQDFYGDDIDREIARRVREVAARRGVSTAHVAMAWVAGSPNHNVPIVGAAKTAHLEVAVEALGLRARCRGDEPSSRRPTGRAMRSTTRTRCGVPARCIRMPRLSAAATFSATDCPVALRSASDDRRSSASRTDCARCSALAGARGMAAEALRQSQEVRALGLHADARNLPPVHLIHDLLQGIVVPHDDRKREAFFRRRGELIDREHDPAVARDGDHRPMRRADLGADGHRQGDAEGTISAGVVPAALHFHRHCKTAGVHDLRGVAHHDCVRRKR